MFCVIMPCQYRYRGVTISVCLRVQLFKGCPISLLVAWGSGVMSEYAAGAITQVAAAAEGSGSWWASHAAVILAGGSPTVTRRQPVARVLKLVHAGASSFRGVMVSISVLI